MTAEIAVLNKSAVALAADSAGTIGAGGAAKIYNGFNKIIEIGDADPVALMVYGGLDYMGLPVEVLAKEFRRRHGQVRRPRLEDHASAFLDFLRTEVPVTDDDCAANVGRVLVPYFNDLDKRAERKWIDESDKGTRRLARRGPVLLEEQLRTELQTLRERPYQPEFLAKAPRPGSRYDAVIEEVIDWTVRRATGRHRRLLLQVGRERLIRGTLSAGRTGLVIAGFGSDDLCPSLCSYETDGMIFGKLKYAVTRTVDIGRRGPQAEIVGFAQSDMVGAFLDGVDPNYRIFALQVVKRYLDRWVDELAAATAGHNGAQAGVDALRALMSNVHREISDELESHSSKNYRSPILDMIRFMPNQELATLAASLIDITSLKRKVTKDRETVGGEVDVAVISKSEGFVWIKRKHYFPADLNPRFFDRARLSSEPQAR